MKKIVLLLVSVLMVLSLSACGGSETEAVTPTDEVSTTKSAILVVNGSLGDLGFFDSANRGMLRLEEELGFDITVIETGSDETKWEPALVDAAEENVDYVIACSPSMIEPMERIAPDFPDMKFILIDNAVDYESYDLSNVYCATFKQNEGSFLAGVAAAITAGEEGKLGFVGGMDIPPINDFLVGYIEGAVYANPDIKVIATYPGDYYDPAKGKEHAIVLINQGVNCIFTAAGPT
jgi:basic membrane protein A